MDWLKLPTSFRDNASRLEAQYRGGAAAIVLYVDCYLWAAQHETDGILPAAVVASLVAGIDDEAVAALLTAGLWKPAKDGGVHIVRFLTEQKSRAEIEQTRVDARNRKAKERRAHRDVTRESHVSHRTEVEVEREKEGSATDVQGGSRARAVSVARETDPLDLIASQDPRVATRG
jgi:hypothetical protein